MLFLTLSSLLNSGSSDVGGSPYAWSPSRPPCSGLHSFAQIKCFGSLALFPLHLQTSLLSPVKTIYSTKHVKF